MKKTKRWLSLLLCMAMLVSALAMVPVNGVSAQTADKLYEWIEPWQIPIASVDREGDLAAYRINDGVRNITNTWDGSRPEGFMDYYGYRFVNTYIVDTVVFQSGERYGDGGYFANAPVIRVLQDGVWNEIEAELSPVYDGAAFTDYTFTFEPVACDGIMVYGEAGGAARFISCSELKVRAEVEEKNALDLIRYEFERYTPTMQVTGQIEAQNMDYATNTVNIWSRSYQVLWRRGAADKELSFDFFVAADGEYNVNLLLTKAGDFGTFAYAIDGVQIGEAVDSFANGVEAARVNDLGTVNLTAGDHTFTITALSETEGRLLGGFDAFELEKVGDYAWIQYDATPIASVVRDGLVSLNRIADGGYTTFTNLYEGGKNEETLDWVGYEFDQPYTVTELRYTEGKQYSDGGWFREVPAIKVLQQGEWVEIEATVTPEYNTSVSVQLPQYTFTFDPVECEGIMVSGKPGGGAKFISCGEVQVRAKIGDSEEAAPELFSIGASDGVAVEDAGKYNITWNANIALSEGVTLDAINDAVTFKEYGVIYGVSEEAVEAAAAGDETDGAKIKSFAKDDDIDVYTIFGFRLKNVDENKTRAAQFYVTYEYNGKVYTEYSDCILADTSI